MHGNNCETSPEFYGSMRHPWMELVFPKCHDFVIVPYGTTEYANGRKKFWCIHPLFEFLYENNIKYIQLKLNNHHVVTLKFQINKSTTVTWKLNYNFCFLNINEMNGIYKTKLCRVKRDVFLPLPFLVSRVFATICLFVRSLNSLHEQLPQISRQRWKGFGDGPMDGYWNTFSKWLTEALNKESLKYNLDCSSETMKMPRYLWVSMPLISYFSMSLFPEPMHAGFPNHLHFHIGATDLSERLLRCKDQA